MVTKTNILILADDLTGANDTAIQFSKFGFSVLVVTHIVQVTRANFENYDVISINTDSRRIAPNDAYRVIQEVLKTFEVNKNSILVYKKIDSVLRGNPGQELAAVMDSLDISLALVAPAFPANRSVLTHGYLPSGVDAVRIFADGSGHKTVNIPLETIRQGAPSIVAYMISRNRQGTQIFVADAVNDTDLETIFAASTCLEKPHLLSGSAGLANQLARHLGKTKDPLQENPLKISQTPALIVAGSRQAETASQILTLSQLLSIPVIRFKVSLVIEGKSDEAIKEALTEVAEQMRHTVSACIIAVESMFTAENTGNRYTEEDEMGKTISFALGRLIRILFDDFHFSLLVSTGGDTSMEICKQLGISCMEPIKELYPGIPLTRIVGGEHNGRYMITKSGRFGEPDTLVKIMEYINE